MKSNPSWGGNMGESSTSVRALEGRDEVDVAKNESEWGEYSRVRARTGVLMNEKRCEMKYCAKEK